MGGIVTRATRAIIGEAGPEAVIPLPKMRRPTPRFGYSENTITPVLEQIMRTQDNQPQRPVYPDTIPVSEFGQNRATVDATQSDSQRTRIDATVNVTIDGREAGDALVQEFLVGSNY